MCKGNVRDKNEAATLKYITPEMIQNKASCASPAMDVWAIGIMMYIMLFYKFPFNGDSKEEIKQKIIEQPLVFSKKKAITPEAAKFLTGCLTKDPEKRITISEMIESDWLLMSDDALEDKVEKAQIELDEQNKREKEEEERRYVENLLAKMRDEEEAKNDKRGHNRNSEQT